MDLEALDHRLRMKLTQPGRHWVIVGVILYGIACLLPAMRIPFGMMYGWECLTIVSSGWETLISPLPWWWANPSILMAIVMYGFHRTRASVVFAAIAVGLAAHCEISTLYYDGIVPIGCIVWVASLQVIALNSIWQVWVDRKQRLERLSFPALNEPVAESVSK